jgi:RecT family
MADSRVALIEEKLDREQTGLIALSTKTGAVTFEKIGEAMDFAKLMAVSDKAIPGYLRGNVGACLAVAIQANEWGFSPFAVARMSYVVNDQISYMSQLVHAVVERRAPLRGRLRFEFEGEGGDMACTVRGQLINEVDPLIYTSPKIRDIKVKNSPLWASDPQQQLSYYSARAWARRYTPDVMLGIYSQDELEDRHIGPDHAKDVSPSETLHHRLSAQAVRGAGFNATDITATINEIAPDTSASTAEEKATPSTTSRSPADVRGGVADTDASHEAEAAPPPGSNRQPQRARGGAADIHESAQADATSSPGSARRPSLARDDVAYNSDEERPAPSPSAERHPSLIRDGAVGEQVAPSPENPSGPHAARDGAAPAQPEDSPPWEPSAPAIAIPKDGADYPSWVRANLADFEREDDAREWWKSPFEKKLRNTLPNVSQEVLDEAKAAVASKITEIKLRNKDI